jgi:hypothetical protein
MAEEWKDVVGYEGSYQVSSYGRVRSVARTVNATKRGNLHHKRIKPRILSPSVSNDPNGYHRHRVVLRSNGKSKTWLVHVLVLTAFKGPRPFKGAHSRHLDGNPLNNHVDNLAWGTCRQNSYDKARHGTQPYGEKRPNAKLTWTDVDYIRKSALSQNALARKFGVCQQTICEVKNYQKWRHRDQK